MPALLGRHRFAKATDPLPPSSTSPLKMLLVKALKYVNYVRPKYTFVFLFNEESFFENRFCFSFLVLQYFFTSICHVEPDGYVRRNWYPPLPCSRYKPTNCFDPRGIYVNFTGNYTRYTPSFYHQPPFPVLTRPSTETSSMETDEKQPKNGLNSNSIPSTETVDNLKPDNNSRSSEFIEEFFNPYRTTEPLTRVKKKKKNKQ